MKRPALPDSRLPDRTDPHSSPFDIPDSLNNNPAESTGVPKLRVEILEPEHGARVTVEVRDGEGPVYTFRGQAFDSQSGPISRQIRWRSSRDGFLGTGAKITSSFKDPGVHTISASVTDSSGKRVRATIGVYALLPGTDPTDSAGGDLDHGP